MWSWIRGNSCLTPPSKKKKNHTYICKRFHWLNKIPLFHTRDCNFDVEVNDEYQTKVWLLQIAKQMSNTTTYTPSKSCYCKPTHLSMSLCFMHIPIPFFFWISKWIHLEKVIIPPTRAYFSNFPPTYLWNVIPIAVRS